MDESKKQVLISNYPLNNSIDEVIQCISSKMKERGCRESQITVATSINNSECTLEVSKDELDHILDLNGSYIFNNPIWIIHYPDTYLELIPCLSLIFTKSTSQGVVNLSNLSKQLTTNGCDAALINFIDFKNLNFVEFLFYRLGSESRDNRFFVENLILENNEINDISQWYRFRTFLPTLHQLKVTQNPITKTFSTNKWPYLTLQKNVILPKKGSPKNPPKPTLIFPWKKPTLEQKGKVWALSDFHLPSTKKKFMDKYDQIWVNHQEKIRENVTKLLTPNDILLVPGDISWATKIDQANPDFEFLGSLPCTVIISEGNHDKWASKYSEVMASLPSNTLWCQRECHRIGNVAVVAARLWEIDGVYPWPGEMSCACDNPEKMQKKSIDRLIDALGKLPQDEDIIRILMVHFPPLAFDASSGVVTNIIDKYNVHFCVYGHVHGLATPVPAVNAVVNQTHYFLTSADWLKMIPMEITEYKY